MLTLPSIAHSFGKYDSRNGDECRAQVNANYDALAAEMQAHGNLHGIAVMNRKHRAPDLEECDQMDQRAQEALMSKAYQRLSTAIETIRKNGSISTDLLVGAAQQQDAEIGGQRTAVEVGADGKTGNGRKAKLAWGRITHGRSRFSSSEAFLAEHQLYQLVKRYSPFFMKNSG